MALLAQACGIGDGILTLDGPISVASGYPWRFTLDIEFRGPDHPPGPRRQDHERQRRTLVPRWRQSLRLDTARPVTLTLLPLLDALARMETLTGDQ